MEKEAGLCEIHAGHPIAMCSNNSLHGEDDSHTFYLFQESCHVILRAVDGCGFNARSSHLHAHQPVSGEASHLGARVQFAGAIGRFGPGSSVMMKYA